MEVHGISHITVGFHTKPIVIVSHHCRFYHKTDSDVHYQCRFCFKTGSDVSAPYKKKPPGSYTHIHAPSLHSHFSVSRTLTSHSFHSTWFGHRSWYFIAGGIIYMFSSSIFSRYVYIPRFMFYLVCDILLGIFYIMHYIYFYSYFLNFIRYNAIYIYSPLPYSSYVYASIYIYLVCNILLSIFYIMQYIFLFTFLEFY
jgi:hypothetical protein